MKEKQKPRWYSIDNQGAAWLCTNKKEAQFVIKRFDEIHPQLGPHRAVQLVDATVVKRLKDKLKALKSAQGQAVQEPVAWLTFDGEGGYDLRLYEHNESYRDDYIKRNGINYASWVQPLYATPPDTTALLRQALEILEGGYPQNDECAVPVIAAIKKHLGGE